MDDKKIEDKIYEESKLYEIKTSSIDILEKYNKQKKPIEIDKKKSIPWWKRKPFQYGIGAFSIIALAGGITTAVLLTSPSSPINPSLSSSLPIVTPVVPPSNNSILNQASYEIIAGSSILSTNETNTYNKVLNIRKKNNQIKNATGNNTNLETAIKAFDTYSPMIINMGKAISNNSYYTPIESDNQNYKYAIKIQDTFTLYYNDAFEELDEEETTSTINAILKDSTKTYNVVIEKEIEKEINEIETSLKTTIYYTSTHYIVIEKSNEVEVDEKEDSYELKEYKDNKEPILDLSFELETENKETENTFKIEKAPNLYYSYEYKLLNFSFLDQTSFTIVYESYQVEYNNGVYTYNGSEIVV